MRDGVGEDAAEILEAHAGSGDQVVDDAHVGLGDDAKVEVQQVVVVFVDRAVKGVFDGDHGGVDLAVAQGDEDVLEARAGLDDDGGAEQVHGSLMAEGAGLALKGRAQGGREQLFLLRSHSFLISMLAHFHRSHFGRSE